MQKLADRGYRLVLPGGPWTTAPWHAHVSAFEKCASDAKPVDYLFLGAERSVQKYQKKADDASAQGYRFLTFVPDGFVMQREKGKSARTHELKMLMINKVQDLQAELLAEAQKGFRIAGMIRWPGRICAILERPD